MLNIKTQFEKNAFYANQKQATLLVEIMGKKVQKNSTRLPLNIALVIDVSGSMDEVVKRNEIKVPRIKQDPLPKIPPSIFPQNPYNPNTPWVPPEPIWCHDNQNLIQDIQNMGNVGVQYNQCIDYMTQYQDITKLSQVKSAAIKSIEMLENGDKASLVIFSDKAVVIAESCEINEATKKDLIKKITSLHTQGSTNLHDGWIKGSIEVAKHMSEKTLNRVILLTDGQVNVGVTDIQKIIGDCSGLYKRSISTTTFGVGKHFDEDLLQSMSTKGGGNYYYIEEGSDITKMFEQEFLGLNNLVASDVKAYFTLHSGFEITNNVNNFEQDEKNYIIPNITTVNKNALLFKMKIKIPNNRKNVSIGTLNLSYKDDNGKKQTQTIELKIPVVSKAEYEKMAENQEVKIQETLFVIANDKLQATLAMDRGDYALSKSILRNSLNTVTAMASSMNDVRLHAESSVLNDNLQNSKSDMELRKDLSYQSYNTRYSK